MNRYSAALAASAIAVSGCNKKELSPGPADELASEVVEISPKVATHLGIAARVPSDVDLFIAGYDGDEMLERAFEALEKVGMVETKTMSLGDVDSSEEEEMNSSMESPTEDVELYIGDEAFVFVGSGAGAKLQLIGQSYRELSAAWAGFVLGQALKMADSENFNMSDLGDSMPNDLVNRWIESLENGSRLEIPTVVLGWRPAPEKLEECIKSLGDAIQSGLDGENGSTAPIRFTTSGCELFGIEILGNVLFKEVLEEAREGLEKQEGGAELWEKVSPEQIEQLLAALEKFRFTVAVGQLDGRIVIYLGNGTEGFQLAEDPEHSLAATDSLRWTAEFKDKDVVGISYFSEPMVSAALPWLDTSDYWESLADAIRPPIKNERLIRDLLLGLGEIDHELAQRDASAFCSVLFMGKGLGLESRGGWPDPGLDYHTPMKMTHAVESQNPAIRAHWIQNRDRNDLSWAKFEQLGILIEAGIEELEQLDNSSSPTAAIPDGALSRFMDELRNFNRAYREEFRAGIGNEVALFADMKGEMPPVPGLSEEVIRDFTIPRFVMARPVTDRSKIDASGKSFAKQWRGLTEWVTALSGNDMPLILPQAVESNDLVTWFAPLPFIGGDFLPGVTLSDDLWMLGTSRSMAANFSKSLDSSSSAGETGMIVDVDLEAISAWAIDSYRRSDLPEKARSIPLDPDSKLTMKPEEFMNRTMEGMRRFKSLHYHQWLADGIPRTSIWLEVDSGD